MDAFEQTQNRIDPKITVDSKPFWDACAQHRLIFQQCAVCGHVRWPASVICPECSSFSFIWTESRGIGRVYSFVIFRRAFHPYFENRIPYVVASVLLEEGPVLLTNIVGCEATSVECDMPVEVVFLKTENRVTLPLFSPRSGSALKGVNYAR